MFSSCNSVDGYGADLKIAFFDYLTNHVTNEYISQKSEEIWFSAFARKIKSRKDRANEMLLDKQTRKKSHEMKKEHIVSEIVEILINLTEDQQNEYYQRATFEVEASRFRLQSRLCELTQLDIEDIEKEIAQLEQDIDVAEQERKDKFGDKRTYKQSIKIKNRINENVKKKEDQQGLLGTDPDADPDADHDNDVLDTFEINKEKKKDAAEVAKAARTTLSNKSVNSDKLEFIKLITAALYASKSSEAKGKSAQNIRSAITGSSGNNNNNAAGIGRGAEDWN